MSMVRKQLDACKIPIGSLDDASPNPLDPIPFGQAL